MSTSSKKMYDAFFWVKPIKSSDESKVYDKAEVVWHYPEDVSRVVAAFRDIPNFCFPDLETLKLEKAQEARIEHFTFTLTDEDGGRVYGVCMRHLDGGVGQRYDVKRRPRHCLCIITKNPFFAMFRSCLLQVHSMTLLDQSESYSSSSCQKHFLAALYAHKVPSVGESVTIPPSPSHWRYTSFSMTATAGGSTHSIAPLMEVLGIEKFFLILSAILCENRVVFIATDVDRLSDAVHAVTSMLLPFRWQHIFIPLLPSKLLTFVSSPMPFIIGVRRYLLPALLKEALSDVILVDADSGECTVMGEVSIRDILGAEAASNQSSSSAGALSGMGLMRAGVKMFRDSQLSAGSASGQPVTDGLMNSILNVIRPVMQKKPAGAGVGMMRMGRSAADTSRDKWMAEVDKATRQALLLFYVYLFGDISDDLNPAAARASMGNDDKTSRGEAKKGESFGIGDSRAAFNLQSFLVRRRQMGTSNSIMEFLDSFTHSQMFERFCAERVQLHHSRHSLRKSVGEPHSSGKTVLEVVETEYDKVCVEMRMQHLSSTLHNIRHIIDEQKWKKRGVGSSTASELGEQFHSLALQLTSNTSTVASSGKEEIGKVVKGSLEEVCMNAVSDAVQMERVLKTVWLRLEDCKQFNWKHGLRGLQLLHVLLLQGPHAVLSEALDHFSLIQSLTEYSFSHSSTCPSESRQLIRRKAHEILLLLLDNSLLALQRRWVSLSRVGAFPFYCLQEIIVKQRKVDAAKLKDRNFNFQSPNQIPSFSNLHESYRPPEWTGNREGPIPSASHPQEQPATSLIDFDEGFFTQIPSESTVGGVESVNACDTFSSSFGDDVFGNVPNSDSDKMGFNSMENMKQDGFEEVDSNAFDSFGSTKQDRDKEVFDPFFGSSAKSSGDEDFAVCGFDPFSASSEKGSVPINNNTFSADDPFASSHVDFGSTPNDPFSSFGGNSSGSYSDPFAPTSSIDPFAAGADSNGWSSVSSTTTSTDPFGTTSFDAFSSGNTTCISSVPSSAYSSSSVFLSSTTVPTASPVQSRSCGSGYHDPFADLAAPRTAPIQQQQINSLPLPGGSGMMSHGGASMSSGYTPQSTTFRPPAAHQPSSWPNGRQYQNSQVDSQGKEDPFANILSSWGSPQKK
mmetsp:Transcript_9962/g.15026  ORF Transcript_9962/g.15026 Transcript_9962/m.15026 type:complete len:1130 (+) Transcript_9962:50-3439(+)